MDEMIYKKSYEEYKAELDCELQKSAEGFVRIGYLLKVARDTDILEESGYKTVAEFAEAEYNLNKTQVSRFISINDKFSEGGYSDHLLPTYQGYGYAKLTIMLQLPDEINEELEGYSKSEIQAIKEEVEEEKKISDLEVIIESATAGIHLEENDLQKTVRQLGKDMPDLFELIFNDMENNMERIICPDGIKTYSVRIQGIGRKMLMLKDSENGDDVTLIDVRSNEKNKYEWEELVDAWRKLFSGYDDCENAWESIYCEIWPLKKKEIAPVQQPKNPVNTKSEPKKQQKKESKVVKAAESRKPTAVEEPKKEEIIEPEEQIPGQDSILEHPEYMPEPENITDQAEIVDELPINKPVEEEITADEQITNIWNDIKQDSEEVSALFRLHDWGYAVTCDIDRLKELYNQAINLAAGLEKIINLREEEEND